MHMDIDVFSPHDLGTAFRVLRTALGYTGPPDAAERRFLQTYARISGFVLPEPGPEPIAPAEVQIDGAHQRVRMVQLAAIAALLARPVRPASIAFVGALARQLAVEDGVVDVLEALGRGRFRRVRMLAMRRAMRSMFREAYAAEGRMGIVRLFGAMFLKLGTNREKSWRYKRLGLLPEGTMGREYWCHLTRNGFGFPGEPGGIADSVAYHDVGHVLTGYDASPQGEIQQGSFQGGNRREDGFFFIQFVLLHFHQGVKVTPGAPPTTGLFDPEKVLWAIHRGAQYDVDITHQWNFWPWMELNLAEARRKSGMLPAAPFAT